MRRIISMIAMVIVGVWMIVTGCNCKTSPGQYNPTTKVYDTNVMADVVVVSAQHTRQIAADVFDGVMTIEAHNEAALKAVNPRIHESAEQIRRNGKKWLDELSAAIKDYQSDRSSTDKWTALKAALKVVEEALVSAGSHLAEATRVTSKGTP